MFDFHSLVLLQLLVARDSGASTLLPERVVISRYQLRHTRVICNAAGFVDERPTCDVWMRGDH